jgi:hypothetical protein
VTPDTWRAIGAGVGLLAAVAGAAGLSRWWVRWNRAQRIAERLRQPLVHASLEKQLTRSRWSETPTHLHRRVKPARGGAK